MYQLSQTELASVNGGFAPVSFITGYILGSEGWAPVTGVLSNTSHQSFMENSRG